VRCTCIGPVIVIDGQSDFAISIASELEIEVEEYPAGNKESRDPEFPNILESIEEMKSWTDGVDELWDLKS